MRGRSTDVFVDSCLSVLWEIRRRGRELTRARASHVARVFEITCLHFTDSTEATLLVEPNKFFCIIPFCFTFCRINSTYLKCLVKEIIRV